MDWLELSASVANDNVETVCAVLEGIAPGGLSIEEPIVPLGPEEGVRREPWRPSTIRLYLPDDGHLQQRWASARDAVATLDFAVRLEQRRVREEDWANSWKEFFHVEHIGSHLVIRPTWRDYAAAPGEVVLDLDPGMAFGTGQHETTRMCLSAIEEIDIAGKQVLDLGCGSGILAVAAAKLGAAGVTALDIEPLAVEAARENAARNGASSIVRVAEGSLGTAWPYAGAADGAIDVVLANIHAGALQSLARELHSALRDDGVLIGSGIIAERLEQVLAALRSTGFGEPQVHAEGESRAIVVRRAAPGR